MGNSGSSYQYPQEANGPSKFKKMGRGWTTHSYPRELHSSSRYSKSPPGQKVLPDLPNQMTRGNNRSKIHDEDSSPSSFRPLALTLPHDLNKNQITNHYQQILHHHRTHHQQENPRSISHCSHCRLTFEDHTSPVKDNCTDLKKFRSEPDLRYSMRHQSSRGLNSQYYPANREAQDFRYRSKKKYKAPMPPPQFLQSGKKTPEDVSGFRIDCFKRKGHDDGLRNDSLMHFLSLQSPPPPPPPRKSRLFKTRAQSKMSQTNLNYSPCDVARTAYDPNKNGRHYASIDDDSKWQNHEQEENDKNLTSSRQESIKNSRRRRFANWKNKNTLQRSMSSPDFQAELIQAPKKVRTKFEPCEKDVEEVITCCSMERRRKKSIYEISKMAPKELPKRKSDDGSKGRNVLSADLENLDSNPITKSQQKVHNRNLYYVNNLKFENPKSKSSYREINYLNSRLNTEDKFQEKVVSSPLDMSKFRVDLKVQNNMVEKENKGDLESAALVARKEKLGSDEERGLNEFLRSRRTKEDLRIDKENSLSRSRRRKENSRGGNNKEGLEPLAKMERKETKKELDVEEEARSDKVTETEQLEKPIESCFFNRNIPNLDFSKPKTFYFGMDDFPKATEFNHCVPYQETNGEIQANLVKMNISNLVLDTDEREKESQDDMDDIALKLRPTLPKKPPEVPRFSPSTAWKLLSALETSARSTISDEVPVLMLEEEIERLSCPPPFLLALQDPRSSQDKSGDSGISGDAGAINDDSFDTNRSPSRIKPSPLRPTWTPQQDLDEESSSSEAIINSPSPYPLKKSVQSKPHVFSLSLPREDNRSLFFQNAATGSKTKQDLFFHDSLQKLKRSVSGALGFTWEFDKKRLPVESFDDNWLLSTSAPTSLQHYYIDKHSPMRKQNDQSGLTTMEIEKEDENLKIEDEKSLSEFVTKPSSPPFLSYLVSRGHVMYLPDPDSKKPEAGIMSNSLEKDSKSRKYGFAERDDVPLLNTIRQFSKSCENISYDNRLIESPRHDRENEELMWKKNGGANIDRSDYEAIRDVNNKIFNLNRPKKFTFQSTVRQIERRRLADKLSKEAEAKEKQRKNELEAMNKVEEEFQRKRSREKANIRQQLRLYSMDENRR